MAITLAFSISFYILYNEQVYNLLLFFFFYPNFSLPARSWKLLLLPCSRQVPELLWPLSIPPNYTCETVLGACVLLWLPSICIPNTSSLSRNH